MESKADKSASFLTVSFYGAADQDEEEQQRQERPQTMTQALGQAQLAAPGARGHFPGPSAQLLHAEVSQKKNLSLLLLLLPPLRRLLLLLLLQHFNHGHTAHL